VIQDGLRKSTKFSVQKTQPRYGSRIDTRTSHIQNSPTYLTTCDVNYIPISMANSGALPSGFLLGSGPDLQEIC
jgi:hypothetical protein